MVLVERAKVLHLSIRYVTFHWGLGRLAMLNRKERESLKGLATLGDDGENLVSFYDAFSRRKILHDVFEAHLMKLFRASESLDAQISDGQESHEQSVLSCQGNDRKRIWQGAWSGA